MTRPAVRSDTIKTCPTASSDTATAKAYQPRHSNHPLKLNIPTTQYNPYINYWPYRKLKYAYYDFCPIIGVKPLKRCKKCNNIFRPSCDPKGKTAAILCHLSC